MTTGRRLPKDGPLAAHSYDASRTMQSIVYLLRCVIVLPLAALIGCASGPAHPPAPAALPASLDYTYIIGPGDSPELIVEKAAKVLPRPRQSAWMRLERTFFLHYGPNSFRGVEWGDGREDPALFNPTALDANQWVAAMKNAASVMPTDCRLPFSLTVRVGWLPSMLRILGRLTASPAPT